MRMLARFHTRRAMALVISSAAALLVGCASDPAPTVAARPAPQAKQEPKIVAKTFSGFLNDYSALRPSPRHPDTLYQQSRALTTYKSFIVDPIEFYPSETQRGGTVDESIARQLAQELRDNLLETLDVNYEITEVPAFGVARVRAAITQIARSRREPDGTIRVGGASIEAEIVDSVTGKRLGAVLEADVAGEAAAAGSPDPFQDAKLVFQHWASRLNLWLQNSADLATEE